MAWTYESEQTIYLSLAHTLLVALLAAKAELDRQAAVATIFSKTRKASIEPVFRKTDPCCSCLFKENFC